jgi:acetylornithine deacetylase/succinyl-diaminopimelate desuccinylase-like protein
MPFQVECNRVMNLSARASARNMKMPFVPSGALAYAKIQRAGFLTELKDFLRFPSVSAQPKHAQDLKKCAGWLADHLWWIGMDNARVIPTRGHPLVYAEWWHAPGCPTVLTYGHYDVQPPDPLHEWCSPPFEPTVSNDDLYAGGASDDKGQVFTHIKALESYLRTDGRLPVSVKCLFEGEEEIGSSNLKSFLGRNRRGLAADVAVVSDTPIVAPGRPATTYAMRGALSIELEVRGSKEDLHSGIYGGAVHNPL